MVSANHGIADASQAVQSAATRGRRNHAVARRGRDRGPAHRGTRRIRRPHRDPPRRRLFRAGPGRESLGLDRGDRQADQSSGAERNHRGRARRRCRTRLCGGRQRSEEPRGSHPAGDPPDRRHRSRPRRPARQPDRRKRRSLLARQDRRRRRATDPKHHRPRAGRLYQGRPARSTASPRPRPPISVIATR